jgi:hypothetical protein
MARPRQSGNLSIKTKLFTQLLGAKYNQDYQIKGMILARHPEDMGQMRNTKKKKRGGAVLQQGHRSYAWKRLCVSYVKRMKEFIYLYFTYLSHNINTFLNMVREV